MKTSGTVRKPSLPPSEGESPLRICDILNITEEVLRKKNIENPRLTAELLLASVLNAERIELFVNFEKPLIGGEITRFREQLRRRLNHEPLQYILGWWEFYGIRFKLSPAVLIPRPETETLVEESIRIISVLKKSAGAINDGSAVPAVLEIGTGSGCISISIANKCECLIDAIDISAEALDVAKANAERTGVTNKIRFLIKNIFTDFENFNGYDIVISNPPYIASNDFESLPDEIRKYEPRNALTDGKDGMSYYTKMIDLAKKTKEAPECLTEIGDGKRQKVEELLRENGINQYEFKKDLMGMDRVVRFGPKIL